MKEFKKIEDVDDGAFHTQKHSNGEYDIVVDIDGSNYEINAETEYFNIHYQNVAGHESSRLSEGFGMSFLSLADVDRISEDVVRVKAMSAYIEESVLPSLR